MRYEHIVRAVLAQPWAINPDSPAWAAALDVLSLRASGGHLTDAEIDAALVQAADRNGPRSGGQRSGAVAVIPVYGVIESRMHMTSRTSGGTSAEAVGGAFATALNDPEVGGIVFDIDSPGGNVEGIHELASQIRAARGQKPIAAVANHSAASAAYWIAAAADEVVVAPSGQVGSIGIISAHEDLSAQMEQKGIRVTFVTAGKYKAEGHPFAPLAEDALAERQSKVDAFYRIFVSDVAKGRGVSVETVRAEYGQGRTVLAQPALERGMVDRVDTLDNTIRRVARGDVAPRSERIPAAAAMAALPPLVTTYEAVGGVVDDDVPADDQGEPGTPAVAPEEQQPAARVVPARRMQRVLHEAALRVGRPLT